MSFLLTHIRCLFFLFLKERWEELIFKWTSRDLVMKRFVVPVYQLLQEIFQIKLKINKNILTINHNLDS